MYPYKVNILYFNIRVSHPTFLRVSLSVGVLGEVFPTELTHMGPGLAVNRVEMSFVMTPPTHPDELATTEGAGKRGT